MLKYFIVIFLALVIFCNFYFGINIGKAYNFQTIEKEFTYSLIPSKGGSEALMLEEFQKFKATNVENEKLILYRTFKIKFYQFWFWRQYFTDRKFKYPMLPKLK